MKKLLLLFICVAFLAPVAARAGQAPCTSHGINLMDGLEKSNPALLAELTAEAAATPNSKGIFWKIEKDGVEPSYLFGTIHLSDPRVMKMPQAASEAYDSAQTVVIEAADITHRKTFPRIMQEQPDLMLFNDGTTLESHLPKERRADIEQKLVQRGIVLAAMNKIKPWVLSNLLASTKCERARKARGELFLDEQLAIEAQKQGREVKGLESIAEQFAAMNSLPLDFHIRNLIATVDFGDKIEDSMETAITLYLQGDVGMISPALRKIVPEDLSDADYALFQKVILTDRNHLMVDRAAPLLEKGGVFLAIGALHLPGKEGVVELLRQKGYRLTAL